jgi:glycosyltransferase involved in cell wall biosynthesis
MRITFHSPPPNYSGGVRVIAEYAARLKKRGHEVAIVFVPRRHPGWRNRLRTLIRERRWLRHHHRAPSHYDDLDVKMIMLDERRKVTDEDVPDADVIVATYWNTAPQVMKLSPRKGAKAYFIQHYEAWQPEDKNDVDRTWQMPLHKIVVCEWLGRLAEELGDSDYTLAPNSVDLDVFRAPERERNDTPCVGWMYSLAAWKGCDVIHAAVEKARREIPELRTIAFGMSPPPQMSDLPEGTEFHLQPEQEEIPRIYASCDAWLFGSRSEGFGLPILEAMACRTPVIGTPAGAAPELLSEECGTIVRTEDPEDMARAIVELCRMPAEEWKQMSTRAYRKAQAYTWEDATDRFEQGLVRAIEKSRG